MQTNTPRPSRQRHRNADTAEPIIGSSTSPDADKVSIAIRSEHDIVTFRMKKIKHRRVMTNGRMIGENTYRNS